jgi:hypothetical protein
LQQFGLVFAQTGQLPAIWLEVLPLMVVMTPSQLLQECSAPTVAECGDNLPLGLLDENCWTGWVRHFEQSNFGSTAAGATVGATAALCSC